MPVGIAEARGQGSWMRERVSQSLFDEVAVRTLKLLLLLLFQNKLNHACLYGPCFVQTSFCSCAPQKSFGFFGFGAFLCPVSLFRPGDVFDHCELLIREALSDSFVIEAVEINVT